MESKRQKTFKPLNIILSVSVVLLLILLLSHALPAVDQFKVVRVIDGDTIKLRSADSKPDSTIKYLSSIVLNKYVQIKSYGTDRYGRTFGVVYCNGTNVNLEMAKAGLAEVYRMHPAKGFDNDSYWKAEKEAREADRRIWSLAINMWVSGNGGG